jgi:PHD/YefM family antitoxin component YafN of YafNO toxin-antitoxin module
VEVNLLAINSDTLNALVSISQFNKGQANKIFSRAKAQGKLIVLKNNEPEAVILSPEEFQRMSEIEEDYHLLLLAQERLANWNGQDTISEQQLMENLGITEADLEAAGELEIE